MSNHDTDNVRYCCKVDIWTDDGFAWVHFLLINSYILAQLKACQIWSQYKIMLLKIGQDMLKHKYSKY